jgi:hypothetical protein
MISRFGDSHGFFKRRWHKTGAIALRLKGQCSCDLHFSFLFRAG